VFFPDEGGSVKAYVDDTPMLASASGFSEAHDRMASMMTKEGGGPSGEQGTPINQTSGPRHQRSSTHRQPGPEAEMEGQILVGALLGGRARLGGIFEKWRMGKPRRHQKALL
jgi:hypothetical protein